MANSKSLGRKILGLAAVFTEMVFAGVFAIRFRSSERNMANSKSLGRKILGLAAVITVLVFAAVFAISFVMQRQATQERMAQSGRNASNMLALAIDAPMLSGSREDLTEVFRKAKDSNRNMSLTLTDAKGRVKFTTLDKEALPVLDDEEIQPQLAAAIRQETDASGIATLGDKRVFFQARSVINQARCQGCHDQKQLILGSMITIQDLTADWAALNTQMWVLGGVSIVGILVLLLGLRWLVRKRVTDPLAQFGQILRGVAEGDVSREAKVDSDDEIGLLGADLNKGLAHIRETILEVIEASNRVASGATTLSASAEEMSATTNQLASSGRILHSATESVAAAAVEFLATVEQVSGNVKESIQKTESAVTATDAGAEGTNAAAERMARVQDATERITRAVSLIQDLARQTNLLSLNAAIEAAKAGHTGKGFSVVAEEVRKLAERSRESAAEIIRQTVDTREAVQGGVSCVESTSQHMGAIQDSIRDVNTCIHEIGVATRQQASAAQDIARQMEHSAREVGQNAAAVQQLSVVVHEISRTAADLARVSEFMARSVSRFKA